MYLHGFQTCLGTAPATTRHRCGSSLNDFAAGRLCRSVARPTPSLRAQRMNNSEVLAGSTRIRASQKNDAPVDPTNYTVSENLLRTQAPECGQIPGEGVYCSGNPESVSARLVRMCPSICSNERWYRSPWLLANGHASTIWSALRRKSPKVQYNRECLVTSDGGTVGLDNVTFVEGSNTEGESSDALVAAPTEGPLLILVPGLGGDSSDSYVLSMAQAAVQAGFRCVVVNSRGCGSVEVSSPQLFSARRGSTADLRFVIGHLAESNGPGTPMFACGWSNGGSIVLNTLREYDQPSSSGEDTASASLCPLAGAVTMSVPYDMNLPSRALGTRFGRLVYDQRFVQGLMPKIEAFLARWSQELPHIDPEKVRSSETLQDMEAHLISPMFGYESVYEYYRDASTTGAIPHIRVPTLCVSAGDDPIAPPGDSLPLESVIANEAVALVYTAQGGHIGWPRSYGDPRPQWAEDVTLQFIRAILGNDAACSPPHSATSSDGVHQLHQQ